MNLKTLTEAYFAHQTGIPLKAFIESKEKTLARIAPKGVPPFHVSVQPDGSTVSAWLETEEAELADENVLRKNTGDSHADWLQREATHAVEEISEHEMSIRDLAESVREHRQKQDELLLRTVGYHFARREALKNGSVFMVIAAGEIGALFFLFSDFFGLDPQRFGSEFVKHPGTAISTIFFTISVFVITTLVGERVLNSRQRILWAIVLLFIALLIGAMRAMQAVALQETETSPLFLMVLYSTISLVLPLAAAEFAGRWKTSSVYVNQTDSETRAMNELEERFAVRTREAHEGRQVAHRRLEGITEEFSGHYQRAVSNRDKSKRDWEEYGRRVEAELAEAKTAYQFWDGREARGLSFVEPIKRFVPVALAFLLILLFSLIGCNSAHANSFNLLVICDRSSSANELSCSQETMMEAAEMWIRKADEGGGGSIEIFLIGNGFDSTDILFSESYPERFPGPVLAHKKKWKNDFLKRLREKTNNLPTSRGSAIAEAIYRASLRITSEGKTEMIVLSDMRQVSNPFNFEKTIPQDKEFLRWLDSKAIKPRFKGVTRVSVCGVHPYTPSEDTSRMTTETYERLSRLLGKVFEQWGVKATISEVCDLRN